jgi:hypothetical protein
VVQNLRGHSVFALLVYAGWKRVLIECFEFLFQMQFPAFQTICMPTQVLDHQLIIKAANIADFIGCWDKNFRVGNEMNELEMGLIFINELHHKLLLPAT